MQPVQGSTGQGGVGGPGGTNVRHQCKASGDPSLSSPFNAHFPCALHTPHMLSPLHESSLTPPPPNSGLLLLGLNFTLRNTSGSLLIVLFCSWSFFKALLCLRQNFLSNNDLLNTRNTSSQHLLSTYHMPGTV